MRRKARAVLLFLFLAVGFCCAVGMTVSLIAEGISGVEIT